MYIFHLPSIIKIKVYTVYASLLKAITKKNNYVCDIKYIITYTNQYTSRSQMAGIA